MTKLSRCTHLCGQIVVRHAMIGNHDDIHAVTQVLGVQCVQDFTQNTVHLPHLQQIYTCMSERKAWETLVIRRGSCI